VLAGAVDRRYHGGAAVRWLIRRAPQADANNVAHVQPQKMVERTNEGGWAMFGARHAPSAGDCFHSEATPPGRDLARLRRTADDAASVCLHQMNVTHRVFDGLLPPSTPSARAPFF
jgi:hypothetical protein